MSLPDALRIDSFKALFQKFCKHILFCFVVQRPHDWYTPVSKTTYDPQTMYNKVYEPLLSCLWCRCVFNARPGLEDYALMNIKTSSLPTLRLDASPKHFQCVVFLFIFSILTFSTRVLFRGLLFPSAWPTEIFGYYARNPATPNLSGFAGTHIAQKFFFILP